MTAPAPATDPAITPTPATDPAPQATEPPTSAPEPAPEPKPTETVDFWKAQARKQEERAKANADAAAELQKIKDRDLTDLQRVEKERDAATAELAATKLAAMQAKVALDKGLTADIAAMLQGDTAEAMSAHADQLIAWRDAAKAPAKPQPNPAQGAHPATPTDALEAEYEQFKAHLFPNHNTTERA